MLHTIGFVGGGAEKTPLERRAAAAGHEVIAGPLATLELATLSECDLVIAGPWSSVSERVDCLAQIEPYLSPGAILATDAPFPTVDTLARTLGRPEQFLAFERLCGSTATEPTIQVRTTMHTSPGVAQAVRGFFETLGERVIETPHSRGPATSFGRRPSRVFGPPARVASRAE